MNINYKKRNVDYITKIKLDPDANNILIMGRADNYNERNVVINPLTVETAEKIYGKNSELAKAYKQAVSITKGDNVFTVNCRTYGDFKITADFVMHYDFSYLVPIGIKFDDTFFDLNSNKEEYYVNYFLNLIEQYDSTITIVMTGNNAINYDNIDKYIKYLNSSITDYYKHCIEDPILEALLIRNGTDIIYTTNNLLNVDYANVILAAQLSNKVYTEYLPEVNYATVFDLDKVDINNINIVYHKYNYLTRKSSTENLVNLRLTNDIYKNALIDSVIKDTIRAMNLSKYKGRLYNAYIKMQIEQEVQSILKEKTRVLFKEYEIINIGFVKTEQTAGYIYIEVAIVPFGFAEEINIVLEV